MPEGGDQKQLLDRVLMLAPTPRDAAMARRVLAGSGFAPSVFRDFDGLADALEEGAGVVVLMEEFFVSKDAARFLGLLARQPAWSNLPLIVLSSSRPRRPTSRRPSPSSSRSRTSSSSRGRPGSCPW